ncbi:MAG: aldehyde dehydrogenase family protein, partial [Flavobacterium sp.]
MSNQIERPTLKVKYDNYINGKWTAPSTGQYFDVISPVDGKVMAKAAHSAKMDIENAVNAAHTAFEAWSQTSKTTRSILLNKIADRIEANLTHLAAVETLDNGKAIRETMAADLPLAIDHFRYFASVIRAEEGSISELDKDTVSIIVHEPIGVVAQIIPWNFPILMAVWKLAPALAAGNCVVLKPAESTPISIMVLMELIEDLVPAGVINIVNGFGAELGRTLVTNPKVAKAAFTGSTATGRMVMQYATENIIPVTLELGGNSPNIFFPSVM